MASVPYKGYGDVEPTGAGTPNVRVSTPVEAFGGGVAQAIGHLGKTVEGAGDELWRRAVALQEVRNKADAEAAETQFMMTSGDLHAEYNSLQGKAAVDAFPKYKTDLDGARVAIRDGLGNDYTKRLYDSASRGIMGRHVFNGAGHAAAQNKRYIAGTSAARLDGIRDYVMHNPGDESAYEDGVQLIQSEVRGTQAAIAGWGKDQTDVEVGKNISSLTASRIVGLARTQPLQAKAMFEQYKDRLHGDDLDKVDRVIQVQTRTIGSRIIADQAGSQDPNIPLEKAIADGEAAAARTAPEDPTLKDFVRQRIIGDRNQLHAAKVDRDRNNREVIDGALIGGIGSGKLPTSIEELIAIKPEVQQAWENLDAKDQRRYLRVLARNAKGETAWTQEGLKQYQVLKGMAEEDPEKFMNTDVISQDIPNSAKRELINLQQRKRKNIDADPRVLRALRDLAPMMHAAGIEKSKSADDYYQFRAGIQDALDDFQKRSPGKTPTSKEVQEIGSRLIQEQKEPGKYLGFISGTTPLYRLPVPDEERVKIDQAFQADKGRKPTEEEAHRIFIIKKYQDLYGTAKPAKPQ